MLLKQKNVLTCLTAVLLSLLTGFQSLAQTTTRRANQPGPVRQITSAVKTKPCCFAIMGEVVQPGVYRLDSSAPFLSNLVRISGGLTKKATGHLRIVRQGRTGQQTFFTPSLNLKLLPGDLIVADSKIVGQPTNKVVHFTDSKSNRKGISEQDFIQIGFVNLVKRPVVVKIRRDYATLPQVVKFLGQPQEIMKNIRVISSSRRDIESSVLPNCSLLIFEKPVPLPEKIPDLPATLDSEQLAHAGPIGIEEPDPPVTSQELVTSDQTETGQQQNSGAPLMLNGPTFSKIDDPQNNDDVKNNDNQEEVVMLPPPGTEPTPGSLPKEQSHLMAESDVPVIPTIAPALPIEIIPPTQPMLADKESNKLQPENKSAINDLDNLALPMNSGNPESLDTPSAANTTSKSSSNAVSHVFGLLLIVGGGIFIWMVAPQNTSSKIPQHEGVEVVEKSQTMRVETPVVVEDDLLEAIINDELTIVSEQVILPVSLELYGRPTGLDKLRIDASHDLSKPHFKPSIPQPVTQDEASQTASAAVATGVRIDPPINLEGAHDSIRTPLVTPASSRSRQTNQ